MEVSARLATAATISTFSGLEIVTRVVGNVCNVCTTRKASTANFARPDIMEMRCGRIVEACKNVSVAAVDFSFEGNLLQFSGKKK